jgi:hypothetical protein
MEKDHKDLVSIFFIKNIKKSSAALIPAIVRQVIPMAGLLPESGTAYCRASLISSCL